MTYAIVQIGGKQYRVAEGDSLTVNRIADELRSKDTVTFDEVLLVHSETDTKIGTPFVTGAKVVCKLTTPDQKGDKLRVFKFKSKSRYRKTMGHRQHESVLEVASITA
jgi:large subunit ribosomal protein L21